MFDVEKFRRTQYQPRVGAVLLPALAYLFPADAPAEFRVRGLDGTEFAKVQEAEASAKNWTAILEGLAGDTKRDKIEALQQLLGRSGDVPAALVRRIEALEWGLVEPQLDRSDLVKLAAVHPVEFQQLSNEVFRLTGIGQDPGKPEGSGATPASEPPSVSGNSGASPSSSSAPTSSPEGA